MPEIPDNPDDVSSGKRTPSARPEPPAAENAPGAGEAAPNAVEFGSQGSGRRGKNKPADKAPKKASRERGAAASPTETATGRDEASQAPSAQNRAWRVPDSVQERFIQIGNKFHFPDGTEAFTHHGNKLTTRSENAIVIQSMVAIAREAGRGEVTVSGTEFFKKEAWFAASLAGLDVRGYAPTEFERERLARALAARRGAPSSEAEPAVRAAEVSKGPVENRPAEGALIVGRLVDHGPAPYGHDPKQPMSYFVRVETEHGDREIWGVDLERAFRQSLSTPGIGDEIGLRGYRQGGRDGARGEARRPGTGDRTGRDRGAPQSVDRRTQELSR